MALDMNKDARSWFGEGRHFVAYQEIDCSDITVPSDGKVKAITIPSGFIVDRVRYKVETAEGSAADLDIGDSSDDDQFADAVDINDDTVDVFDTTGGTDSPYTSEDYIQLFFKDNAADTPYQADTCVIQLWVEMVDFNTQ